MSQAAVLVLLLAGLALAHPGWRVRRQSDTAVATGGRTSSSAGAAIPSTGTASVSADDAAPSTGEDGVELTMSGAPAMPAVPAMPVVPAMAAMDGPYQPTGAEIMSLFNRILEQVQKISQQTAAFSEGRNDLGGGWSGPWGWQWSQAESDPSVHEFILGGGGGAGWDDPGSASRSGWQGGGWVDPASRAGWRGSGRAVDPSLGEADRSSVIDPGLQAAAGSKRRRPGSLAWPPFPNAFPGVGSAGFASASTGPKGLTSTTREFGFNGPAFTRSDYSGFGGLGAPKRPIMSVPPRVGFGGPIGYGGGPDGVFRGPDGLAAGGAKFGGVRGFGGNDGRGLSGQGGFNGPSGGGSINGGGKIGAGGSFSAGNGGSSGGSGSGSGGSTSRESAGVQGGFVGSSGGQEGASAMGFLGPHGGFGSARVFGRGEGTRFGEGGHVNSSPGGFKSVVTSSSSGTSTVNGQTTSHKDSFVGLNDNGKVTTFTAHDP